MKNFKEQYMEEQEKEEKGEMKMAEQIEKGTMYTINRKMVVVETDKDFSNPLSYDKEAIQLFLDNNKYALERYFNDNENNYGISFYECGYNGTAQDEFIKGWKENGVKVV